MRLDMDSSDALMALSIGFPLFPLFLVSFLRCALILTFHYFLVELVNVKDKITKNDTVRVQKSY